jgi:hypothetical protein
MKELQMLALILLLGEIVMATFNIPGDLLQMKRDIHDIKAKLEVIHKVLNIDEAVNKKYEKYDKLLTMMAHPNIAGIYFNTYDALRLAEIMSIEINDKLFEHLKELEERLNTFPDREAE